MDSVQEQNPNTEILAEDSLAISGNVVSSQPKEESFVKSFLKRLLLTIFALLLSGFGLCVGFPMLLQTFLSMFGPVFGLVLFLLCSCFILYKVLKRDKSVYSENMENNQNQNEINAETVQTVYVPQVVNEPEKVVAESTNNKFVLFLKGQSKLILFSLVIGFTVTNGFILSAFSSRESFVILLGIVLFDICLMIVLRNKRKEILIATVCILLVCPLIMSGGFLLLTGLLSAVFN